MTKINVLRKKVENIEKKIRTKNQNGIPEWALEYARKKLSSRINISIGDHKPHRPHTEEDIIDLAIEVSKFASPEEYEASLPPMDFSALRKAMDAIDRRMKQENEEKQTNDDQ